ncbi:hypothetical protein, partial [Fredinandcohnia sp. 179-A 10B2 NHS]|uniref:hypothetical protein n=1 Tax=Fredinandcohnia sp. 179-A 10B2 NHS TaxID=3235176 RepID=UPI0039A02EE7
MKNQLGSIKNQWDNEATPTRFHKKYSELVELKQQYEQIPQLKANKIRDLEKNLRNRQLIEYLDRHYIQSSQIDSIGPSRKAVLQSYGIETASDINKRDVMSVPGLKCTLCKGHFKKRPRLPVKDDSCTAR